MGGRLESLDLLLALVQAERDKQREHFDALDGKAGIVLGFSGLLIALAPDASAVFRVGGVLMGSFAAALALWSFWPRSFPLLEPSQLRRYLSAEPAFTRLTVLDTFEGFINEGSVVLGIKGRRLRWALGALAVAVGSMTAGIVVAAITRG